MTIRKWNKAPGGRGYRVMLDGKRYFIDLTDDSVTIFAEDGARLCGHSEHAESAIRGKSSAGVLMDYTPAELSALKTKYRDTVDIDAHQRALNTPFFNDLAG